MHLDRAAEQATPPVGQPRRIGAVDCECGDTNNRRCFLVHVVLLLWTGHTPAAESVHVENEPYWMFRKGERILPSMSMRSNKALPAL
jgi:hypothetical protein